MYLQPWKSWIFAATIIFYPVASETESVAQSARDARTTAHHPRQAPADWSVLYETTFGSERDLEHWEFVGGRWSWQALASTTRGEPSGKLVLDHAPDRYQPPFRSPTQLALLKDISVDDFQLDLWVRSTHEPYGHRDVCVFFGYVAPDQYYYSHLADQTDDRANQIFIVHRADREKISHETTTGTPWDDQIHHLRVRRTANDGVIEVFFDDMCQAVMRARAQQLAAGRVGIGSFDDSAEFFRVALRGNRRPAAK